MKSLKEFALFYRRKLDWSIIPLHPETKIPIVKWKKFQKELPSKELISEWWDKNPDANIGVITGELSQIVVFDCDSQEALDYVKDKGLVETACVQSSLFYKRHFYFEYPRCGINNLDGRYYYDLDLDVKGDGGIAVLPPSIHVKYKTPYKWIASPFRTEIAEMDIWQLEFCKNARKRKYNRNRKYYPKYTSTNPSWVDLTKNGVTKGNRDIIAFKLACFYARKGYTQYQVEDTLNKWNLNNCPPLKQAELKKCIRSGFSYVR